MNLFGDLRWRDIKEDIENKSKIISFVVTIILMFKSTHFLSSF